jgi:hypothetical protein
MIRLGHVFLSLSDTAVIGRDDFWCPGKVALFNYLCRKSRQVLAWNQGAAFVCHLAFIVLSCNPIKDHAVIGNVDLIDSW